MFGEGFKEAVGFPLVSLNFAFDLHISRNVKGKVEALFLLVYQMLMALTVAVRSPLYPSPMRTASGALR